MSAVLTLPITAQCDVEQARRDARALALALSFGREGTECVALTVLELATNLLRYARDGVVRVESVHGEEGCGLRVVSQDEGPGIAEVARALEDGYSTGGGLGSGLPAVRRLMDTFSLATAATGTRIVACKWRR